MEDFSSESLEETLTREVEQVVRGDWTGPVRYPDLPIMIWWTPFTGDDGVQQCGDHKCFVTNDRKYRAHPSVKTFFFYGTDFQPYDVPVPRRKGEDWALLHEESMKNNAHFCHEEMMRHFNHTSTFRLHSDLPLTTQYLESLEMITDPTYLLSLESKNQLVEEGLAPVAYVQSSCDTPSMRDLWVEEFSKHIKVDSYGSCLNNKPLPPSLAGSEQFENREYFSLLGKYKFVIAVENAVCDDYVTEKLWRTLMVGAVPIYLGAGNIEDYLPNQNSAVLVKDFDSAKGVADFVLSLHHNDEQYVRYLRHKAAYNNDPSTLVTNSLLREMLSQRQWGVSREQQRDLGNSVAHFQCLVCQRVARNLKHTNIGFKPLPFDANIDHYGCPIPVNPKTFEVRKCKS